VTTKVENKIPLNDGNAYRLIGLIEAELEAYSQEGIGSKGSDDLIPKWNELVNTEPSRFINQDGSLNVDALKNFRRSQIFVPDLPGVEVNHFNPRNLIGGERRGNLKVLRESLDILEEYGCLDLLRKYPCSPAGNPYVYRHQGYSYTFRWAKHIYSISVLNEFLGDKLDDEFVALDIGSSYGIFSSLVKREHPGSHHVLVDFPEQLILAYYFLGTCFPDARIAGVKEFREEDSLSKDFFRKFDFCLIPHTLYSQINGDSMDLVTNFASLGEMSRTWFDYYVKAPPFQTAKYLFTANRIKSNPDYDTDLTILDYPIWEPDKLLHFTISPVFSHVYHYRRKHLFFNERRAYPPAFEYIGRI